MTDPLPNSLSLSCPNPGDFQSNFSAPLPLTHLDRSAVSLLATDMDGTVTHQGEFDVAFLQALRQLQQAHLPTLIVTGRSAGWVSGIAHYLPIAGAIAENGGVFFPKSASGSGAMELLVAIESMTEHRQALRDLFEQLRSRFPHLKESSDNPFRQTDWTFDVAGLSPEALLSMAQDCDRAGWDFTYSTVQCHIMKRSQNKSAGLYEVLKRAFPEIAAQSVVTVGDSPNDEPLFAFDRSVGVANVQHYLPNLRDRPKYLTTASEGAGFCELVSYLTGVLLADVNQ